MNNERYTPGPVVAGGAAFAGVPRFDLDAAACLESHHAPAYFTIETDGLQQPWFGAVWLNPPYDNIEPWAAKAAAEVGAARAQLVCMLVPATRTEQAWWQEHVEARTQRAVNGVRCTVRNLRGRTKFIAPGGIVLGKPKFGCCYVLFTRELADNEPISRRGPRPAVTPELVVEGRRLLAEGSTVREMCDRIGVDQRSWYRALHRRGVAVRRRARRDPRAVSSAIERKVARLRREGLSMREIGERLGIHINTVNKYLSRRRKAQPIGIMHPSPNPP